MNVGVTHGYANALVRWLREERGLKAYEVSEAYTKNRSHDDLK